MTEMTLCGYEVISLANKVIDYNQRYSSTGENDDEYSPITLVVYPADTTGWTLLGYGSISVYIVTSADVDAAVYTITADDTLKLFTKTTYSVNDASTGDLEDIFDTADYISQYGSEEAAVNIAKSLSSILLSADQLNYNASSSTKNYMDYATSYATALGDYNSLTKGTKYWYGDGSDENYVYASTVYGAYEAMVRDVLDDDSILKYYEYYQFKKAIFECTNIEYDDTYGRVSLIEFKFTGDIE